MYEDIAQAVNGNIGNDQEIGLRQYIPVVTGTSGTNGAETYQRQTGWYLRKGIFVDVWVDLAFTGHTGTGNTQISLPYISAITANNPFQGTMAAGTISYTTNYTQTQLTTLFKGQWQREPLATRQIILKLLGTWDQILLLQMCWKQVVDNHFSHCPWQQLQHFEGTFAT